MKEESKETRFDFIETDKRIVDQRVRRHQLTHAEHSKMLKALSDDKDRADDLVVCKEGGSGS